MSVGYPVCCVIIFYEFFGKLPVILLTFVLYSDGFTLFCSWWNMFFLVSEIAMSLDRAEKNRINQTNLKKKKWNSTRLATRRIAGLLASFGSVPPRSDYIAANRDTLSLSFFFWLSLSFSLFFLSHSPTSFSSGESRRLSEGQLYTKMCCDVRKKKQTKNKERKRVLYIYLIFITIIYGCINFYCLTSAHQKLNISKNGLYRCKKK